MDLNSLLREVSIDSSTTLVLRHRPKEPDLRRVLPWLAAEQPDVFNAYQQTQTPRVEKQMMKSSHVVSLIGDEAGRGVFVGLYKNRGHRMTRLADRKKIRGQCEPPKYGHFDHGKKCLWFDLSLTEHFQDWAGKLIVRWPPPEISWSRWSAKNRFDVIAIREESLLNQHIPDWRDMTFTWHDLQAIPQRWRAALSEWRGVYFILDVSDGMGYVGSASGSDNLCGRWADYAKTGHGGNKRLRTRKPENLRFSILERVSPDTPSDDVVRLEKTWKDRLHTKQYGLNEN